jgi:hypothetical protein
MDTGRKRTGRHALALAGEANATHLAAALRGLHLYRTAPNSAWSGGSSVTSNNQLLDVLGKHPGVRDALQHGIALNRGCRITVTAATIGWYITTEARPDIDQSAWEEGVVTGARLEPGDPRLTLRNTMLTWHWATHTGVVTTHVSTCSTTSRRGTRGSRAAASSCCAAPPTRRCPASPVARL